MVAVVNILLMSCHIAFALLHGPTSEFMQCRDQRNSERAWKKRGFA